MKVLGLGNALVDVLVQLENEKVIHHFKFPKGGMQLIGIDDIPDLNDHIQLFTSTMKSGGSAANTIHGLASLGTKCGFSGKVGKDELGDFYIEDLESAGVKLYITRSDTNTGRAYTLITPDTERTFATYLGAAVEFSVHDLESVCFDNFDLIHIEGYLVQNTSLVEELMKTAKHKGLKISLDLASYNVVEANRDFLSRIIPDYVDIVFANEEEAKAYTGTNPYDALTVFAKQCSVAIVKIGKEGSLIQAEEIKCKIDSIPSKVLDTTGAGDQYAAGFLHGIVRKLNYEKCGKIGALLAGKVIEHYGARIPNDLWESMVKKVENIAQSE